MLWPRDPVGLPSRLALLSSKAYQRRLASLSSNGSPLLARIYRHRPLIRPRAIPHGITLSNLLPLLPWSVSQKTLVIQHTAWLKAELRDPTVPESMLPRSQRTTLSCRRILKTSRPLFYLQLRMLPPTFSLLHQRTGCDPLSGSRLLFLPELDTTIP
jgi:hypothetical protein